MIDDLIIFSSIFLCDFFLLLHFTLLLGREDIVIMQIIDFKFYPGNRDKVLVKICSSAGSGRLMKKFFSIFVCPSTSI